MKTSMNTLCRCAAISLLLLALPGPGKAADPSLKDEGPSRITVSFHGDTSHGAGFAWHTSTATPGSDLEVTPAAAIPGLPVVSLRFTGRSAPARYSAGEGQELVHKAEASGLLPATSYHYRVGDAAQNYWSSTGTFFTAPASGAFTFIDAADPQAKTEEECALSADTIDKAFAAVPEASFLALNGDIVDRGGEERQWRWMLDLSRARLTNTTLLPVPGNHEKERDAFIEHFNVKPAPRSKTATGAYYSADYSNAHFIVLNTNEDSSAYSGLSRAQVRWLKSDAAAARERGAHWIIVLMHKGPYTTSEHATDENMTGRSGLRTKTAPLLAELGADLVLQGHDHVYARSKPIGPDGGIARPVRTVTRTVNGTDIEYILDPGAPVYMIPATIGPKTYYRNKKIDPSYFGLFEIAGESRAAAHGPDPKRPGNPLRGVAQNFSAITIDGNRLTVISYEIDRTVNDGQPYIADRFGIIKR